MITSRAVTGLTTSGIYYTAGDTIGKAVDFGTVGPCWLTALEVQEQGRPTKYGIAVWLFSRDPHTTPDNSAFDMYYTTPLRPRIAVAKWRGFVHIDGPLFVCLQSLADRPFFDVPYMSIVAEFSAKEAQP